MIGKLSKTISYDLELEIKRLKIQQSTNGTFVKVHLLNL